MKKLAATILVVTVGSLVMFGMSLPTANAVTLRTVSGTVRDSGGHPLAGVHVGISASGVDFAVTAANGAYTISGVPQSSTPYDVDMLYPCGKNQTKLLVVNANKTLDFTVPAGGDTDAFGYTCKPSTAGYISASGPPVVFSGTDDAAATINLPFTFRYYGTDFTTIGVSTNGFASFTSQLFSAVNTPIPDPDLPNAALYPFWDDLIVGGTVRTGVLGTAPNRQFVIEWQNARFYGDDANTLSFEIVLSENKKIRFAYGPATFATDRVYGTSATVGIENGSGSAGNGFQHSFNRVAVDAGFGMEFTAPK